MKRPKTLRDVTDGLVHEVECAMPRPLGGHPYPYTYYSNKVRKVQDNTGIVHETRAAVRTAPFARCTRCTSLHWELFEPLLTVDDDTVTTCLSCLGARST